MRYVKVLLLGIFVFLALLFFFQNQAPLSQEMQMSLNLFFIPPMASRPLPIYFLVIASFLVGCALSVLLLIWDKFNTTAKYVKAKWRITALEKEISSLKKDLEKAQTGEIKALETNKTPAIEA